MSGLLPDKVLNTFLHNPAYECDGFKMWVPILKKYNPGGKYVLFERVSALYTLKQTQDESISDYMSRAPCLFIGLHVIAFNTMANLSSFSIPNAPDLAPLPTDFAPATLRLSMQTSTDSRHSYKG